MSDNFKCVFDSFDEAFASWVGSYIYHHGFKSYQRLPHAKYKLEYMMTKDGYLYVH